MPSTTSAAAKLPLPVARYICPAPTVEDSCHVASLRDFIYTLTGFCWSSARRSVSWMSR